MTCGIYAIVNDVNGKLYVGKSINIERRIGDHFRLLRSNVRSKDCNRHLHAAFKKYGENSFSHRILESFDVIDDAVLSDRELYWMIELKTTNRDFGYNLRLDTSTKCIVHEDTRLLISENNMGDKNPNFGNSWTDHQKKRASEIAKKLHADGVYSGNTTFEKHSTFSKKFWKENPDKKASVAEKISKLKTIYTIQQFDRVGNLIKEWDSMMQLLTDNPTYYRPAIYNCMSGHKKTYKGFVWKKVLKI